MESEIDISVIMGVYQKRTDGLGRAIDSVLRQTFRKFEFIICDDGCGSEVAGYLKQRARLDSRIVLLRNRRNCGLAVSLNRCLGAAGGRYVARMDADDYSEPERLGKEYEFLESHPEYAFVGCSASLTANGIPWGIRNVRERPAKTDFLYGQPFIHPTVMVRKEVYDGLSGYRTGKMMRRAEDYDFFMRAYHNGWRGYNIPEALYRYSEEEGFFEKYGFWDRIHESGIRFRGYLMLGLMPVGLLYCMKPVILAFIPAKCLAWIHRKRFGDSLPPEKRSGERGSV